VSAPTRRRNCRPEDTTDIELGHALVWASHFSTCCRQLYGSTPEWVAIAAEWIEPSRSRAGVILRFGRIDEAGRKVLRVTTIDKTGVRVVVTAHFDRNATRTVRKTDAHDL
jgi:hypothetical protein